MKTQSQAKRAGVHLCLQANMETPEEDAAASRHWPLSLCEAELCCSHSTAVNWPEALAELLSSAELLQRITACYIISFVISY